MRFLLSTFGSRGDVQPVLALAVALRALGADARVCVPPDEEFARLFAAAGVPLLPAFTSVREWVAEMLPKRATISLPKVAAQVMAAQYEAISAGCAGVRCDGGDRSLFLRGRRAIRCRETGHALRVRSLLSDLSALAVPTAVRISEPPSSHRT